MTTNSNPRYNLEQAQQLARAGQYTETKKSTAWLRNHGYDAGIAKRVFLKMKDTEFCQSLPPTREGGSWADVYRTNYDIEEISGEFYVKFVLEDDCAVVVLMSCKEWGYSW